MAYVDVEGGPTPREIGSVQGTPTIKAFVPKRSSARNEKEVIDYQQGREVADLMRFATSKMPNYVERVGSEADFEQFSAKAREWGLPRLVVLSDKAGQTASTLKALSGEFRRRVLMAEIRDMKQTMAEVKEASQRACAQEPAALCGATPMWEQAERVPPRA